MALSAHWLSRSHTATVTWLRPYRRVMQRTDRPFHCNLTDRRTSASLTADMTAPPGFASRAQPSGVSGTPRSRRRASPVGLVQTGQLSGLTYENFANRIAHHGARVPCLLTCNERPDATAPRVRGAVLVAAWAQHVSLSVRHLSRQRHVGNPRQLQSRRPGLLGSGHGSRTGRERAHTCYARMLATGRFEPLWT